MKRGTERPNEREEPSVNRLGTRVRAGVLGLALGIVAALPAAAQAPTPPPPPHVEAPPPSPGPDAIWVPGHWTWRGKAWVWDSGRWEKAHGRSYVPGRYRQTPEGWVHEPGRWQR